MIKGIRGVPDILPDETGKWQALEVVARDVLDRYGYAEIRTIDGVEHAEVFVYLKMLKDSYQWSPIAVPGPLDQR